MSEERAERVKCLAYAAVAARGMLRWHCPVEEEGAGHAAADMRCISLGSNSISGDGGRGCPLPGNRTRRGAVLTLTQRDKGDKGIKGEGEKGIEGDSISS